MKKRRGFTWSRASGLRALPARLVPVRIASRPARLVFTVAISANLTSLFAPARSSSGRTSPCTNGSTPCTCSSLLGRESRPCRIPFTIVGKVSSLCRISRRTSTTAKSAAGTPRNNATTAQMAITMFTFLSALRLCSVRASLTASLSLLRALSRSSSSVSTCAICLTTRVFNPGIPLWLKSSSSRRSTLGANAAISFSNSDSLSAIAISSSLVHPASAHPRGPA